MKLNKYLQLAILIFLCLNTLLAQAQNFTGGYNFKLPYNDSTSQLFLPKFPKKAITNADKITAVGDKFFANGKAIRFWGVNIVASACFPSKALAPQIAGRMRKMGINLVRIHHYDNPWSGTNGSIFDYSKGTRQLNPVSLDLLEYFIAQLKDNGIYVNINLNNSRTFQAKDGVVKADSLQEFGKGLTLYDPKLQLLQREHASQFLSHINPYTGKSLATDPVVAMVELNNENTLYGMWKSNQLTTFAKGGILPVEYNTRLDSLFCAFLKNKYASNLTTLSNAWSSSGGAAPLQLIQNPGFETGNMNNWALELNNASVAATISTTTTTPALGTYAGKLNVTQVSGIDWHIQMKQSGIVLQKDSSYQLVFQARTDGVNKNINLSYVLDIAPYTYFAGTDFTLTSQWQTFKFSFTAPQNIPNLRIAISPKQNIGAFYFDAFSLGRPSSTGLEAGENFTNCSIKRVPYNDRLGYSTQRIADLGEFYIGQQKSHFNQYQNYLKNTLGVTAPMSGTNALVGPADVLHSTNLDYTDDHSYWNHPNFAGGNFNTTNWDIPNTKLFKDQYVESISKVMAGLNINGKPYTISEYMHAAPNRFRTEMVHAVSAYSSFHDVDGIMFFDYASDIPSLTDDLLDGFFSIDSDHSIMSLFPSCAYAYRNNLIKEDVAPLQVDYSDKWIYDFSKTDSKSRWEQSYNYDKTIALTKSVRSNYGKAAANFSQVNGSYLSNNYTTASNETSIDVTKGVLATNTSKFVALTGDILSSANKQVGAMKLNAATEFGSITWISTDNQALTDAKLSLLTLSTKQQNTNMTWNGTQTVNNNWGTSPTLNKEQTASLTLNINADTLYIYPLNTLGKESSYRKIVGNNKQFLVNIDQNTEKTMWFGLKAVNTCPPAYQLCDGEKYELKIDDPTLTNIQWFKDTGTGAQAIAGANALTYTATTIGTYTYTAKNATACDVENCCPTVIVKGTQCCKPQICIGVKIKRN